MNNDQENEYEDKGPNKETIVKTIIFCPKCQSTDIVREMAPNASLPAVGALAQLNTCKSCGFQGNIFPEIDKENKDALKKIKKRKQ